MQAAFGHKFTTMTISEQIDQFIAENGGNTRDALNVALTRLEVALNKVLILEEMLKQEQATSIEIYEPKTCQGECRKEGRCFGEVKSVLVSGNGFKSFQFDYCQEAREEDERRGFLVEENLPDSQ